jgi:phospho-N-acetylmuramoyl-pentapeptide-transferase
MKDIITAVLITFFITLGCGMLILPLLKKLKARQTVLHYVEEHKNKSGTPTMGGIFFVAAILLSAPLLLRANAKIALVSLAITVGYGIIGFLDDFIKIKFKRNLGLKAYQKIISQLSIALVVSLFVFSNGLIGTSLNVPILNKAVDLGVFIIPFTVIIFLSCTNGVNLTDGLDGLAGGVTVFYMAAFAAMLLFSVNFYYGAGEAVLYGEYKNLLMFVSSIIGGALGFLCFNSFPARVFMGDTGSLALGGAVASVAVFSRNSLYIPIIGIMFVLSCISVIIQVLHYKRTKKRIFLMAPLHHHFQKKGVPEPKIVFCYCLITALAGLACLMFIL